MIEELERHHLIVTGVPPPLPNANAEAGPSTRQPTETEAGDQGEPSGEFEPSDVTSDSSGEVFQWLKMYLGTYVNPERPSLQFVNNREKLRQYLRDLSEAKLKKQTQQNYLKSLKRFLHFHTVQTNLRHEDEALHTECKHFIDFIGSLQKVTSKLVGKEITQKRHDTLIEKHQLTPHDCRTVLEAAKQDFLAIMGKLSDGCSDTLEPAESIFVVYYLEAIIILKHLQRPGVVEHMTMSFTVLFWSVSINCLAITFTNRWDILIFYRSWFGTYYRLVRPQLLESNRKRKRDVEDECNAEGRYNLPSVTSQMAQRTFETAAQRLTEAQKSLVADYLTHSSATAEKHYRMKQCDIIVKTSQLLSNMSKVSRAEPSGEGTRHGAVPYSSPIKQPVIRLPRLPSHNEKVKFFKAFETLLQTYPLSLNGKRPEVKQRRNVSQEFQRKLHTYWGRKQLEMREAHTRYASGESVVPWTKDNVKLDKEPKFAKLTYSDSGRYECKVTMGNLSRKASFELLVKDAPVMKMANTKS
ncbi:hypothetical protein F2P81_025556 [Scophthalmus maximus]|uniref:Ig-like domain-containing protein n=1 Tax=Scophthalmus maximus TaxID=52904 RepID=A0A6A4RS53_SCOMX|nr:hypothetical protein F2P81_025556 [Scophthalmus maximus]